MHNHRLIIALHCFVLSLASLALCGSRIHADPIDEYVKNQLRLGHIPGISLAVLRDGQVIKLAAYGLANVELNVSATPGSVFQIQSITKTFTSTAILLLMEEGKLSLEDPLGKHLEGVPESWKDITLRHLLTHTSGIKDFINEPTASLRIDVSEEEVLSATAPRPLNFAPGEKYAYSNTNYHLLAMIIRKLTGKWYGDFLKERIFDPLGMSETRIVSWSAIIPNRASGYRWGSKGLTNGEFVTESILSYGGGGIVSTAPDMAKYAAAFDSEKLLKRATIEQAWTPARLEGGKMSSYGLGWSIQSVNGHREIGHGGGHITGFSTYIALYPEDKLAVVVLANLTGVNTNRIVRRVAGLVIPDLVPKPPRPIEDKEPEVTALLRDCVARAAEGKLEAEKFTPECWSLFDAQKPLIQALLKAVGPLKSLELLSRKESNGLRTYGYLAKFSGRAFSIEMSLTAEGKIAAISTEEE